MAIKTPAIFKIAKTRVDNSSEGPDIYLEVIMNYGYNIITSVQEFKKKIKKEIEQLTAMNVQKIDVVVRGIEVAKKQNEEEELCHLL
jgi:uncharacterized alkaline shock family protein YloU